MESTNKYIDEQIRRQLDNLEVGYDPSTWGKLAHRMDFESQESVDDVFKHHLGEIAAPMTVAGSWEAFEQIIEADEAIEQIEAETPTDHITYEKLHNLQVPYNDDHWVLMAKRLEEEFSIRNTLYRYKVAEISLMALLLLTVIRFMPFIENWNQVDQPTKIETPALDRPIQLQKDRAVFQQASTSSTPVENNAIYTKPTASSENIGNAPAPSNGLPALSITNEENIGESALPTDVAATSFRRIFNLKILPKTDIVSFKNGSGADAIITAFGNKQQKLLAVGGKKKAHPDAITTLPPSPVNAKFAWELPNVKVGKGKQKGDLRFSIFTTTDLNYVTTPPNQVNLVGKKRSLAYNETLASGYGGGVTISWKKGRWEYQTGGIYSSNVTSPIRL